MKRGKNYENAAKLVTEGEIYTPLQAVRLAKQTSTVKFDASVQVSMRLGVDPRKA
ncbi:MAG TPA: 50S ribosomal protein L1, partial [Actinobacteria bacterium]|nr:50S ribosomal protein L1 [Actinomycetota bacterium]